MEGEGQEARANVVLASRVHSADSSSYGIFVTSEVSSSSISWPSQSYPKASTPTLQRRMLVMSYYTLPNNVENNDKYSKERDRVMPM